MIHRGGCLSRPDEASSRSICGPALAVLTLALLALVRPATIARAQGNYEIQVYGSDTVPPETLMVELHSGTTAATDHLIVKAILGRRFGRGKR